MTKFIVSITVIVLPWVIVRFADLENWVYDLLQSVNNDAVLISFLFLPVLLLVLRRIAEPTGKNKRKRTIFIFPAKFYK